MGIEATDPHPGADDPQQIRNVVLVGSASAGKSSLFERLVTARTPGRHTRGEPAASTCSEPPRAARRRLRQPARHPGSPRLRGRGARRLRAADAAFFVVSAEDGIDEGHPLLWRECDVLGMPRARGDQLEQARADFDPTVDGCQRAFGDAQPLALPVLATAAGPGLLNLLRRTVTEHRGGAERPRTRRRGAELIDAQRGDLDRVGHRGVRGRGAARAVPRR